MLIRLDRFGGMLPGTAPHQLPETAAQIAHNCKLASGALRSWRKPLFIETPAKAGTKQGLFLYEDQYWFHWPEDVNCVYGPIAQDAWRRVYWTGEGAPKMTVLNVAVGGPDYPTASYLLGVPAPDSSPSTSASPIVEQQITGIDSITGDISGITKGTVTLIDSVDHGLSTGESVVLSVSGMTELDGWKGTVNRVSDDVFSIQVNSIYYHDFTSGSWRKADIAVVESLEHGLSTGDDITFVITEGMTELHGLSFSVIRIDDDTFSVPIDVSGYGAFTAGKWFYGQDTTLYEDRQYVVTYVTAYGEEGPPCLPSGTMTWTPGRTVTVSSLPGVPGGNHNITHKRLYRLNTGSTDTVYQRVLTPTYPDGLIPVAVTEVVDDCPNDGLGAVLQSAEWDPPPDDLAGLIVLPNGSLCGFAGKEVCFSVRNRPHAWPLSYRIPVDHPIVSIGAFGTSVLVTTTGMPYLITGEEPGAMGREKLEIGQSCVSKRGTVDMGYAVVYPAPDGLIMAGTGQIELVTEKILTRDEWQAYKPESIHAHFYSGYYVAFYDTGTTRGGFAFNPSTGDFITFDLYATAGFFDPAVGKLYLVVNDDIVEWDGDTNNQIAYKWKSRPFYATAPLNLGCGQVFADSYPITLKIYADGSLRHTEAVTSDRPFRLPSGYKASKWEVEASGVNGVNVVSLATTISELGQAA